MKVQEESEKVGLKLTIQKTKIMASGPITSWQIDGEIVETVSDFIFQFSSVQLLSHVRLFATPWTAAYQASLSFTISWTLLKHSVLLPAFLSFVCFIFSSIQSFH